MNLNRIAARLIDRTALPLKRTNFPKSKVRQYIEFFRKFDPDLVHFRVKHTDFAAFQDDLPFGSVQTRDKVESIWNTVILDMENTGREEESLKAGKEAAQFFSSFYDPSSINVLDFHYIEFKQTGAPNDESPSWFAHDIVGHGFLETMGQMVPSDLFEFRVLDEEKVKREFKHEIPAAVFEDYDLETEFGQPADLSFSTYFLETQVFPHHLLGILIASVDPASLPPGVSGAAIGRVESGEDPTDLLADLGVFVVQNVRDLPDLKIRSKSFFFQSHSLSSSPSDGSIEIRISPSQIQNAEAVFRDLVDAAFRTVADKVEPFRGQIIII